MANVKNQNGTPKRHLQRENDFSGTEIQIDKYHVGQYIPTTDALSPSTGVSLFYLNKLEGANIDDVMNLRENDLAMKLCDALRKT